MKIIVWSSTLISEFFAGIKEIESIRSEEKSEEKEKEEDGDGDSVGDDGGNSDSDDV